MSRIDLPAAARTITNAADHLERMKAAAIALRDATPHAAKRDYYTPTEDEQIRHQVVSYAQWRAALFDIIYRLTDGLSDTDAKRANDPPRFVTAFAAAVLLVDAARFLRDTWDKDPLAVRKLNEPEPHFGIAPGLYGSVQKSLTDPEHAWMLYRTAAFYDKALPDLEHAASDDPAMRSLLEVIARYIERVRVGKRMYLKARLKVRGRQANRQITGGPLLRAVYAIQESVSRMAAHVSVRPGHTPSLPQRVRDELASLLRPGDIFVVRKEHVITNYFLPGYWPHAAMYLGTPEDLRGLGLDNDEHVLTRWTKIAPTGINDWPERRRVLEAMADGVNIRPIDSPYRADAIAVIRPQIDPADIARAISRGMFHEGKTYDFDFDFTRSDRLVCSEVVYRSFEGVGGITFELTRRAGRMTLAAQDLLVMARQRKGFAPVACYSQLTGSEVHLGDEADAVLDATLD